MLLRRLNAGTLPLSSVSPNLESGKKILVVSDVVAAGSVAERVRNFLVDKGFEVQLSRGTFFFSAFFFFQ